MELLEKDFENLTEEEKQIYIELESVKRKIKKSLKKMSKKMLVSFVIECANEIEKEKNDRAKKRAWREQKK